MGYSEIVTGKESRAKIFQGLEEIAMVVAQTLGPKGKNVIIDNLLTEPTITNDGITCVRGISFKDHYKNIAAFMLKKTCDMTNKLAGDGTSTTTILAYALVKEGMQYIENGVNPFHLSKALIDYKDLVVNYVKSKGIPVENSEDIRKIATISSQDEEVGNLIAEAHARVGSTGAIVAQKSVNPGMSVEIKDGLEFDEQLASLGLITNAERLQCELENAYIFVTDKKLLSLSSISSLLKELSETGKSKDIMFIVDDIDTWALNNMIINHQRRALNICVVKAPSYGDKKEAFFQDVCALTSAVMISDKTGLDFKDVWLQHLGYAEKVISWRQSSLIVGGRKNQAAVDLIVTGLNAEIKRNAQDEWLKSRAELRRARLAGGVASINIGFPTSVETENKVLKVEDAINAAKAASIEGIIYGSGVSLVEAAQMCTFGSDASDEQKIAEKIMKKALEYPTKLIFDNAGENGEIIIYDIKSAGKAGFGIDIRTMEWCQLIDIGVIDPVMVIRVALENAVSMANMILSSNVVITDAEEFDDQDIGK